MNENPLLKYSAVGEEGTDGAALLVGGTVDWIVEDGEKVSCLSLVTDLKRKVTARDKNIKKWCMEDAGGRGSAVVFP